MARIWSQFVRSTDEGKIDDAVSEDVSLYTPSTNISAASIMRSLGRPVATPVEVPPELKESVND